MQNPFIVSENIYLRPLEKEDIDLFIPWLNDEEVRQYLTRPFPLNRIRENEWIEGIYREEKEGEFISNGTS